VDYSFLTPDFVFFKFYHVQYTIGSKEFLPFLRDVATYLSKARRYLERHYFVVSLLTAKMLLMTITNQPSIGSMGGTYLMSKFNILARHIAHLAQ
jgi:hypothetical protein